MGCMVVLVDGFLGLSMQDICLTSFRYILFNLAYLSTKFLPKQAMIISLPTKDIILQGDSLYQRRSKQTKFSSKLTKQVQNIYNHWLIMTEFMRGPHSAEDLIDVFFLYAATQALEERQMGEKQRINVLEDHPCPPSPLYQNFEEFIEEIRSSPDVVCNDSLFSGPNIDESHPLFPDAPEAVTAIALPELKVSESQRREKNSNAIKKIGRIILDNLRQYSTGRANSAMAAMLRLLSKDSKVGRNEVNKRDKFNTYHLRALLGGEDLSVIRANLRTTRRILSRHLRRNVLLSRQITNPNKALYLNTMKCSALRCLHQGLAVRLQMSI